MKLFKYMYWGTILLIALFLPTTGLTEEWIKPGEERLKLGGGVFLPSFDTKLRVDNKTLGAGTGVNLEDDLGYSSDETTFWVGGNWRFATKHRFFAG
jgi:hypothetical protein